MRITSCLIILVAFCCGCSSNTDSQQSDNSTTPLVATAPSDTITLDYEALHKLESYLTSARPDSIVQVIDYDCAILIYPNDAQTEELIKSYGEEDFYVVADDALWYQAQAIGILDSLQIKTVSPQGEILRIIGNDRTYELDIRRKNLPAWNLILFKKGKDPKIADTVGLTAEEVAKFFELGK